MGFTYDQNVQAAAFANRRRREQLSFILLLILFVSVIIITIIIYRVLEARREALKAQAAQVNS